MTSKKRPMLGDTCGELCRTIPGEQGALIIAGDQYFWRRRDEACTPVRTSGRCEQGRSDGCVVSVKCVSPAAVRAAFSHEPIDSGWMPPDVRRWGVGPRGEWVVVFVPPHRPLLLFRNDFAPDEPADVLALEVALPGLVFMGYETSYYVWAVKEEDLHPDGVVYHAPLPNLDTSGKVCFGQNKLPRVSGEGMGKAWQLFLESPFTNHAINGKSQKKKYKDDIRLLLFSLARQRRRKYPLGDLASRRITVQQAVDIVLRGDSHWR